jgi:hypothetical protein
VIRKNVTASRVRIERRIGGRRRRSLMSRGPYFPSLSRKR